MSAVVDTVTMPTADNSMAEADGVSTPAAINAAETIEQPTADKAENKSNSGKDRKPHRDRPPLPDPIPTTPVKRYSEPSREELNEKIFVHQAAVRECFEKMTAMRSFFDKRTKIRESGKEEFDAARKRMTQKNDELRALFDSKKSLTSQIKALRDADMNARNEAASSATGRESDALKGLKTVEDVDNCIKDLEYTLAVQSVPLAQEKKIISQISYLKHTGRQIIVGKDQAFQQEKAAKQARLDKRIELESMRKDIDMKIDASKAVLEDFKKEIDGIRAKQDTEINMLAEGTKGLDYDKMWKKINEERGKIRKLRNDFFVELDNWYLNERIHFEQVKIAKKKKWEAQNAEREARRKAWEEEQAQYPEPDPYQKEKDMCAGLIVYLQTLLGETVEKTGTKSLLEKPDVAPSLKNSEDKKRTISGGGKSIGKSSKSTKSEEFEMLAFSSFMQKKGKSKGKKGRRNSVSVAGTESSSSGSEALKPHSIDLLAAFTHLEIAPPTKMSGVRAALNAAKLKKEYYDSDPPLPETTNKELTSKPKMDPKSNGNVSVKDISAESGAFPGLSGSDVQKPAEGPGMSDASRSTFSDIVKKSGVVPSANMFPGDMMGASLQDSPIVGNGAISTSQESPAAPQPIDFTES